MHKEIHQRLATEYRYAATKMQEVKQPQRKLFYFSVIFSETQRALNWEWNSNLALIYTVAFHTHTQINNAMQISAVGHGLPSDWTTIYDQLTQNVSALATQFEKTEDIKCSEELCRILGRFSEIAYAVSGNGSYLLDKGVIKL